MGNSAYRHFQPTHYELRNCRAIQRKFEEAQLSLISIESKIEELEFKRLRNLADETMQMELLQLLGQKNELMQLIEQLQQQKLRALNDDNEIIALLMCPLI